MINFIRRWKRTLVFGAAFGAAAAITLTSIGLFSYWWTSRPVQDIWKSNVLRADYDHFTVRSSDSYYVFYYVLHNDSSKDYASRNDLVTIAGRIQGGALFNCDNCFSLAEPVFIPAHDSAMILVVLKHKFPLSVRDTDDKEGQKELHAAELGHLKDALSRFQSMTMFDKSARIKVDLPGGWLQEKTDSLP